VPNETPGDDVQGIVFQGYGQLESACFVLLRIENADRARAWLGGAMNDLTFGAKQPGDRAMNIGFTLDGLVALGGSESSAASIPRSARAWWATCGRWCSAIAETASQAGGGGAGRVGLDALMRC
jgi:hypothetical protein